MPKRLVPLIVFLIILFFLKTDTVSAATFYLGPSGNDSNPGTEASPWRTIDKANSAIASGDTVILLDGTYEAYNRINKPNTVWKAKNKHKAIVDGGLSPSLLNGQWQNIVSAYNQKCSNLNTWVNLISVDAANVTIDGLFMKNSCGRGILFMTSSSNSILKNSWIDWTMQAGVYVGAETQGVQILGNYLTRISFGDTYKMYTTGDYSVNISVHMSGDGMTVRDNIIAWGRGEIAMTGARNLLVEKNIFVGNKNNFYPGWAQNVVFRNNLVYAPESKDTRGTHWEKKGSDSTHNWHMSTRNEKDDRWSDYATGLTNIAYYNNLIINNQIGFDGYHRAGGNFLYSTDTTKVYFGHNTIIAGRENEKLFGASFNAASFEGQNEDSLISAIIENNIFDNRKNPNAGVGISLSNNDRVVIRNNIIPENTNSSFNGEGNIRTNDPGLIDAARQLSIAPPPIGADTINISELQQAARVMDYLPKTSSPGKDKGSILGGNSDTSVPELARTKDYLFFTRDSKPDMGALEFGSSGGYEDPPTSGTNASLTLTLHGIGSGGDNVNPNADGNSNPLRPTRTINLEILNNNNQSIGVKQGNISFDTALGIFKGIVDLSNIPAGTYKARVKTPNFIIKSYPSTISITASQTTQLPPLALTAGDSNNDNSLSILDYNIILDCYSELTPAQNCSNGDKKLSADLTDDGKVNQFDYNLFLRELSTQGGGGTTPQPTNPNPTNTPPTGATNTPNPQATSTPSPTTPPSQPGNEKIVFNNDVQFTQSDGGFHVLKAAGAGIPGLPINWLSPTNYYNGTWHFRYQIHTHPTNTSGKLQVCIWNMPGFEPESCGGKVAHTGLGTYTYSSIPAQWWKKDGVPLNFANSASFLIRVILLGENNCIVTNKNVPKPCPELFPQFAQMKFKLTIVMVPVGQTFSGWSNYQ